MRTWTPRDVPSHCAYRGHEDSLGTHVEQLFKQALAQTARREALNNLHSALQEAQLRLQQPMRVAIVGVIKAGKSTMMNALLGETVVATGIVEATFNINWLKYAKESALLVHFKDERPPEPKSLAELEQLTRRAEEPLDYLLGIKYIEVFHPNPLLQTLNLIDTPGLASFYQEDARNTLEFLRLHGQELTEATNQERENADAVLYLFSHSLGAEEKALVEQFQGPQIGHTTPINSIGVLTKVDMFWSEPEYPDALAAGNEIIETLQNNHPRLRNIFYTIVPVCGSMAWGIQTITAEEFTVLRQLSLLPEARLKKLLDNLGRFTSKYPDVPIDPEKREKLLRRLGGYGIWRACRLLRAGVHDRSRLEQALLQESGLPALRHLIVSHFGKRAYLIKLASALREIKTACWSARQSDFVFPADKAVVKHIDDQFGRLEDRESSRLPKRRERSSSRSLASTVSLFASAWVSPKKMMR